jgi:hypothetical protein
MPAARSKTKTAAAAKKVAKPAKATKAAVRPKAKAASTKALATKTKASFKPAPKPKRRLSDRKPPKALLDKASILLKAKKWEDLVLLLNGHASLLDDTLKASYCRAFAHIKEPSEAHTKLATVVSTDLTASNAEQVDALLCQAALAAGAGDFSQAADKALAALKAAEYKDQDAIELLQANQIKQHQDGGHSEVKVSTSNGPPCDDG